MSFDNKLTEYELTNKFYKEMPRTGYINNKEEINNFEENLNKVKYFDVLTDGGYFWVLVDDMKNICTQISVNILEEMGYEIDTDVVIGENYLKVSDEFLIYVQKNTNNPKYIPNLCLLKTREREESYEQSDDIQKCIVLAQTVDGQTVEEETYGMSK